MSINTSFQWTVYFPITKTYDFTISADNEAIIRLDGVDVVSTNYSAGESSPYQNTFSGSTQVTQGYHSIVIVAINTGGPGAVGGRITSTTGTAVSVAPVVVDPRTGSARDGYYTRTGSTNPEVTNNSFFNAYTLQGFRRLNTDAELEQESSSQIRQYIVRQNNATVWDNTSPPPAQYLPGTFRGSKYGISADGTLTQGDGYPNDGSGLGDFLNAFDLAVGSGGQTIEIWNSRNPRNNKRKTLGQNGKDHTAGTFDGGGGGGGGGGYVGGAGGYFGGNVAGDLGGGAGFIGRSYVENNDSDSGIIKPALSDRQAAYNNFGTGGDGGTPGISATDGTSGVAVVNATFLTRSLYHKIDNNWKTTKNVFVKDGGIWKSCAEVWVKHNDVWKRSLLKTDSTVVWLSDPPPAPPPTPVEPSLPDPPTITPIEFPNPPKVTPPVVTPPTGTGQTATATPAVTPPVVVTPPVGVTVTPPVVIPTTTCPSPEMAILLANGTTKPAGELAIGDVVRTQHEHTLAWGDHPVTHCEIIPSAKRLKIKFEDTEIICSYDHKFFDKVDSWVRAEDVKFRDILSGKVVKSVEQVESGPVVMITIDDAHTYICQGLLSHNKSPKPPEETTTVVESGGGDGVAAVGDVGESVSVSDADAAAAGTAAAAAAAADAAAVSDAAVASGGSADGGDGGKIICTKLFELGLMSEEIYLADQAFGAELVQRSPDIYNGYRAWAEIVVDWMDGHGPKMMPWMSDEEFSAAAKKWSTTWAVDIATPWAEEMAYVMGKKPTGSLTGRMITAAGIPICKAVGVWQRVFGPSKKPAGFGKGLMLIPVFIMFKLVAELGRLIEGK